MEEARPFSQFYQHANNNNDDDEGLDDEDDDDLASNYYKRFVNARSSTNYSDRERLTLSTSFPRTALDDNADDDCSTGGSRLPHLIVHPIFYQNYKTYIDSLRVYFKVILLEQLQIERDYSATLVGVLASSPSSSSRDHRSGGGRQRRRTRKLPDFQKMNIVLQPHYDQRLDSGANPNATTYYFHKPMSMYRVEQRAPRYVIWTRTEPLPVCATVVERTDLYGFRRALDRAVQWAIGSVTRSYESIVVFDLDRTLVDDSCRPLHGVVPVLRYARTFYDRVVVWSHGSSLHVDENVDRLLNACRRHHRHRRSRRRLHDDDDDDDNDDDESDNNNNSASNGSCGGGSGSSDYEGDFNFDLVLSNPGVENREFMRSGKNLLHLYNFFPNSRFVKAVLVDDSVYNWTPEYTDMFVPVSNDITVLRELL